MGIIKGGFLRILQTFLYALEFCCAAIILGIYSYFLAHKTHYNENIGTAKKAVEGLSGAACLYLIFATLLTCCLGGVSFFAFMGILLDILFCGAMIAVAVLCRNGASSCSGSNVNTPIGSGSPSLRDHGVTLRTACKLNTACFAVAIIAALLFLVTALMQLALIRHHKKEKRFGPGPDNNYTSGKKTKTGKRSMFGRKNKNVDGHDDSHLARDAELGAVGAGGAGLAAHHHHNTHDTRPSHETGYTGTTVNGNGAGQTVHNGGLANSTPYDKVETGNTTAPHGAHGGYMTQPQGTGVNPYGYDNNVASNTATNTGHHYTTGTATNY